jgi:UDP-glucose 4-epimerase
MASKGKALRSGTERIGCGGLPTRFPRATLAAPPAWTVTPGEKRRGGRGTEMILVTGGAGYVGSHCVRALVELGYEVVVLDNLSQGRRDAVLSQHFVEGDLLDTEALKRTFAAYPIDVVLHFAGLICVGESMSEPERYYAHNVGGTINLLREMDARGVKKLIFSSSAAVYGEPDSVPIPEQHPCRPTSVYGRTKWIAEQIMEDCAQGAGLRYIALRYFNAAGASLDGRLGETHCPETHLIPLVLAAALDPGRAIRVFGDDYDTPDGTCVRDYVHVVDLAAAHVAAVRALERGQLVGAYNLGSMRGFSVREVIDVCRRVTGRPIAVDEAPRRPGDPPILVADATRAGEDLGWAPEIPSLEEIVRSAWNWMQARRPT